MTAPIDIEAIRNSWSCLKNMPTWSESQVQTLALCDEVERLQKELRDLANEHRRFVRQSISESLTKDLSKERMATRLGIAQKEVERLRAYIDEQEACAAGAYDEGPR